MSLGGPRPSQPQPTSAPTSASGLTHLDEAGRARMVDVGDKATSDRTARAECRVLLSPPTAALLVSGGLPKGDAVGVTRIAGIQAAKRTWELIPLCHQVALSSVDVEVEVDASTGVVIVRSVARARDRTGVEMEALTAASVAALTLYDMVKAVERGATITDLRLVQKTGGVRGDWSVAEERGGAPAATQEGSGAGGLGEGSGAGGAAHGATTG